MANGSDLRKLFATIDATEDECSRYRSRLDLPRRRPWLVYAMVPVMATVFVAVFLWPSHHPLAEMDLGDLESLAATKNQTELIELGESGIRSRSNKAQINGRVLLCMLQPDHEGVRFAAEGIKLADRSDVRIFFLEYFLDRVDQFSYNPDFISELMDHEMDPVCMSLLNRLMRISENDRLG